MKAQPFTSKSLEPNLLLTITKNWGTKSYVIPLDKWDPCPTYSRNKIHLLLGITQMTPTTHCSFLDWWIHLRKKYERTLLFSLKSVLGLTLLSFSFKSLEASPKITSLFLALMKLTPSWTLLIYKSYFPDAVIK